MGNRRRSSSSKSKSKSKSKRHPKDKKDVTESMPVICDEIIYSILLHLPVRTLVRFRSLSKSYREIISSSSFVNEHMRSVSKSDAPFYFIFTVGCDDDDYWNTAYLQTYRISSIHNYKPRIEQPVKMQLRTGEEFDESIYMLSCNGLVCLFRISETESGCKSRILVWNPATRQRKELNWPSFSFSVRGSRLHCFLGFGYDPSIDDYKIVIVVDIHHKGQWEAQVLSLKENNWRTLVMPTWLGYYYYYMGLKSVAVNGDLYWIAGKMWEPFRILKFNLADESFRFLSMPPTTYENREGYKLFTLDGLLYVSYSHRVPNKRTGTIDIWMLKDHTTWVERYSLRNFGISFELMGFNTNGDVIMTHSDDVRIELYLPKEDRFIKVVENVDEPEVEMFHFLQMETLASP